MRRISRDNLDDAQFEAIESEFEDVMANASDCEQRISNLDKKSLKTAIRDIIMRIIKIEKAIEDREGWMYLAEDPKEAKEFSELVRRYAYSMPVPTAADMPPLLPPYYDTI